MNNIIIRPAEIKDWDFVHNTMNEVLSNYYGGNHFEHAKRIFDTHISGGKDNIGFFSQEQRMYIALFCNIPAGMIHLVLKRQYTCKISPLIISPYFKNKGLAKHLLNKAIQFAQDNLCRQIYCTVSEKNTDAMRFFQRNEFIIAGKSKNQYMEGFNEFMLYKNLIEIVSDQEFDLDHISVLPMEQSHKTQIEKILLDNLQEDFIGIDESWVNALFMGHERRHKLDINEKYKLIFTAVDRNDRVLGIAGATPKKGEPIKLMPFVAIESSAFFALLSDVPSLLKTYGRKVYIHIVPNSEQTRFLQKAGWNLDGVLPDAYQVDRVTQQWSRDLDSEETMKQMRLKKKYLDLMRTGLKTLEVRVGYDTILSIKKGDQIAFLSREDRLVKEVKSIRTYKSFNALLENEDFNKIVPGLNKDEVYQLLKEIYPPNKEQLGVVVFEVS